VARLDAQDAPPSRRDQPNIVLIMADDLGIETLGCYGGTSYRTPHLDRLAATGMRFEHCYSMPVCHPTRVCLLTGRYPFRLNNPEWGTFPASAETQTFAHVLERAGYATAIAGKWQLTMLKDDLDHPHRLGFDTYCLFGWHEGPRYYQPLIWQNGKKRTDVRDRYGPDVYCDFLIDFMERNRDKPFLAYYPMALCHDVTDDLDAFVPFGPKGRWDSYHEMVEATDERVGRIVAALERLKLRDNTLILFTGDNGTAQASYLNVVDGKMVREPVISKMGDVLVPGGKTRLTDGGTRVPLIANWPMTIKPGQVVSDLVDFSDYLPTFAELGNAKAPAGVKLDGQSFAASLLGRDGPRRAWAYSAGRGSHWVRTQRWKLYDDGRLIDMNADPHEKTPITNGSPDAVAARTQLQQALDALAAKQ
jgi:arylsulfatase A